MDSYAVIETGGKQYRVVVGQTLEIEKLAVEAGSNVTFDRVLAISDGTTLNVGTPVVKGAKVVAKVVEQFLGEKLISFKKKRRKGYRKTKGHRQSLTKIEITSLA